MTGRFSFANQKSDLSAQFTAVQGFQNLSRGATDELLVDLGKLTSNYHLALRPKNFDDLGERFQYPVRGFIKDDGLLDIAKRFQGGTSLAGFCGQEPSKFEG